MKYGPSMKTYLILFFSILTFFSCKENNESTSQVIHDNSSKEFLEIPCDIILDKVRGGVLGQIIGNLNGLPHEFKYDIEPGNVTDYVPSLPDGAFTDDDTDIEWVYINHMQKANELFLDSEQLADIWKASFNQRIWCSNGYVRRLLDIGIHPPYTGSIALNPWAEFNISGQFISETFGLICPAMPQSAARLGLNYTHVTIGAEPAQTTQFYTTMIAMSYVENDINKLLEAGYGVLDPNSKIRTIIDDIKKWHKENPEDWRKTRRLLREKYTQAGGSRRDNNGYELITGATVAAMLYGKGDFVETLQTGFNYGWDCDNVTATMGTMIGTIMGHKQMMAQGWDILDRYQNISRDGMPEDETITSFADRVYANMEQMILKNGGKREIRNGQCYWLIPVEEPGMVEELPSMEGEQAILIETLRADIEAGITDPKTKKDQARAVYLSVCLDIATKMSEKYPEKWENAKKVFNETWKLKQQIFHDEDGDFPSIKLLRKKFIAAGIVPEEERLDLKVVWHEDRLFMSPKEAMALDPNDYQKPYQFKKD